MIKQWEFHSGSAVSTLGDYTQEETMHGLVCEVWAQLLPRIWVYVELQRLTGDNRALGSSLKFRNGILIYGKEILVTMRLWGKRSTNRYLIRDLYPEYRKNFLRQCNPVWSGTYFCRLSWP